MNTTSHLRRGRRLSPCHAGSGWRPAPPPTRRSNDRSGAVSGEITLLTPIFEGTAGQKLLEDELLPQFYEQYPDVTVSVDYTTYGKLNEKLTTAAVSGLVPDVMMMGVGWIEGFADTGLLADLSDRGLTEESCSRAHPGDRRGRHVERRRLRGADHARHPLRCRAHGPPRGGRLRRPAVDLGRADRDGRGADGAGRRRKLTRAGFDMLSLDARQVFETMLFSAGGDSSTTTTPSRSSTARRAWRRCSS